MGFLDFFRSKGKPIEKGTLIKRMTAQKADWETLVDDPGKENTVPNVWCINEVHITVRGGTACKMLVPCQSNKNEMRDAIKKQNCAAFYVSPETFSLSIRLISGEIAAVRGRFKCSGNNRFAEWVRNHIIEPGKNWTAEDLNELLDQFFTNEASVRDFFDVESYEQSKAVEPQPEKSLAIGNTIFGRYKIEKELGVGGMGRVFLASNGDSVIKSRRQVVLKVLHDSLCKDDKSRELFIKEAETLSALRDDRIAACYECRFLGNTPVLVMEYIEGISLNQYLINKKGTITEAETRELLRPIAAALDYAHDEKKIYHLDVKPLNIIVRDKPKDGHRTCLLDFGVSKRAHADGSVTMTMSVTGTYRYMSPERSHPAVEPSSAMDVYSLAVTAYECMMGKVPYPNGWEPNKEIEKLKSDSEFAKAVMRGLSDDPKSRPNTCSALIDPPKPVTVHTIPEPVNDPKQTTRQTTPKEVNTLPPSSSSDSLTELKKSFENYRMMLAQSANRSMRENKERADWMKKQQGRLRDLTVDLNCASADDLVQFFNDVKDCIAKEMSTPDDFFIETIRLLELRNGLPKSGGPVWQALKNSIS